MVRTLILIAALALPGCGSEGPTAPSPFQQSFSGTAGSGAFTRHTVSIPRAGTGTFALTNSFAAGDFPRLEVFDSQGRSVGVSGCVDGFCARATPVVIGVQPGSLELRVSLTTSDRNRTNSYTLSVEVR